MLLITACNCETIPILYVSLKAWAVWLEQQKMLVNENRLNLADPEARKYLKEQTENYFFGDGADSAQGFVPVK